MPLQVDFDRDSWLYVPTEWPWMSFGSLEEWRDAAVRAIGDAYGYDANLRDWLGATLEGLVRGCGPDEERFAYMARPHDLIGMVSLYEWASSPDLTLEELLGATDPAAVRAPVTTPFAGGALGDGFKTLRFASDSTAADGIVGVAHWVWRTPDSDIVLIAGDSDLVRFQALQDSFDDLARSISHTEDAHEPQKETA